MPTPRIIKPSFGEIASVPYRQHPRYRGVVGHWIMGEGGGTKVRDISGFGNDGVMEGMVPATDWVVGHFGHALNFDKTNNRVAISGVSHIPVSNDWSISAWVNMRSIGGSGSVDGYIFSSGDDLGGGGVSGCAIILRLTTGLLRLFTVVGTDSEESVFSNSALALNEEVFITGTKVGTLLSLYLNGLLDNTITLSSATMDYTSDAPTVKIGARTDATAGNPDGFINEIRVWDRGLNANEVVSLYADLYLEFRPRKQVWKAPAVAANDLLLLDYSKLRGGLQDLSGGLI